MSNVARTLEDLHACLHQSYVDRRVALSGVLYSRKGSPEHAQHNARLLEIDQDIALLSQLIRDNGGEA